MLESFLITSRETLEASLVVGIVLSYLNRTDNRHYKKTVYSAIVFGILASIIFAFIFSVFAGGLEGRPEEIFEGSTMLIGAFLLTTMILWMMKQRHISQKIHGKVQKHLEREKPLWSHAGIFILIFIAIIREGVETVIFLSAIKYSSSLSFIGGTLGIITAIIIGYLVFIGSKKINIKRLFNISSVLLILFAAGLVSHGVHEFEEAKLLNGIITPLFDINPAVNPNGSYPALHEKGIIGSFLKGLFGYNGNPSLLEVIVYIAYLVIIFLLYRQIERSAINTGT